MWAYIFLMTTQHPWIVAAVLRSTKECRARDTDGPYNPPQCTALTWWGRKPNPNTLAPYTMLSATTERRATSSLHIDKPPITAYQNTDFKTPESSPRGWWDGSARQQHLPLSFTVWAPFPGTTRWIKRTNFCKLFFDLHTCTEMHMHASKHTHTLNIF